MCALYLHVSLASGSACPFHVILAEGWIQTIWLQIFHASYLSGFLTNFPWCFQYQGILCIISIISIITTPPSHDPNVSDPNKFNALTFLMCLVRNAAGLSIMAICHAKTWPRRSSWMCVRQLLQVGTNTAISWPTCGTTHDYYNLSQMDWLSKKLLPLENMAKTHEGVKAPQDDPGLERGWNTLEHSNWRQHATRWLMNIPTLLQSDWK